MVKAAVLSLQQCRSAGRSCRCEDAEGLQMILNACSIGGMQEFFEKSAALQLLQTLSACSSAVCAELQCMQQCSLCRNA